MQININLGGNLGELKKNTKTKQKNTNYRESETNCTFCVARTVLILMLTVMLTITEQMKTKPCADLIRVRLFML